MCLYVIQDTYIYISSQNYINLFHEHAQYNIQTMLVHTKEKLTLYTNAGFFIFPFFPGQKPLLLLLLLEMLHTILFPAIHSGAWNSKLIQRLMDGWMDVLWFSCKMMKSRSKSVGWYCWCCCCCSVLLLYPFCS